MGITGGAQAIEQGEGSELQQALAEEEDLEPEEPAEISAAAKARQKLASTLENDPEKIARAISTWMAE
jgi:flagellar biosynthesis/type III secretory pathway M-ring protein FliF/YscJ